MPLAGKEGFVAARCESLGQGGFLMAEVAFVFRGQYLVVALPCLAHGSTDVVGYAVIDGIFAGQNTRPRRRADLTGGVTLGEAHALVCDTVDVRSLMQGGTLNGHVLDAEVVGEDEEEVWFVCFCESEASY